MTDSASTIADRVRPFLSPLLAQALDTRTAEGLAKYGQTLDDNHKPDRAKVVHFLQELLDASQYAEWWEQDSMHVPLLTNLANQVAAEFPDLTLDELLFKEGNSRVRSKPIKHIQRPGGMQAWCGVPLDRTMRRFETLDEAEGALTGDGRATQPCHACWVSIHLADGEEGHDAVQADQ